MIDARWWAAALFVAGCTRGDPPGDTRTASSAPVSLADPAPVARSADAGVAPLAPSAVGLGIGAAPFTPVKAKAVGHTSLVFKLENADGQKAIFRAAFKRGPSRYRGEIAAYRLARALGIAERIAFAAPHSLSLTSLRGLLGPTDLEQLQEQALAEGDRLDGALVRWLVDLQTPPFERDPWVARWKAWLDGSQAPSEGERELAAQFSDLMIFDYLTGNFDRWSGGNLGAVAGQGGALTLRYIDNDGAFLEPMPQKPLAASRERLWNTRRFSSSFVGKLRALVAQPDLHEVFGDEAPGRPLLRDGVLRGVHERAREVLARIDELAKSEPLLTSWP